MKKSIIIAGISGMLILQSCGSEKKKEAESDSITTEQTATQPEVGTTDTSQLQRGDRPMEATSQPTITTIPVSTPSATAEGMNPAHGQPGHRCDIAVGAPLSSPPGQQPSTTPVTNTTTPSITPNPTTPQTIQVNPQSSPAASGPTPAGMNPPHGQPGHDCSVAVGAPLKK